MSETKIRTVNYDAVITSDPLNETAGRAISQSGEHYDPSVNYGNYLHWDAPPKLRDPASLTPAAIELIGRRFGRMTVLGIWADSNPKKNAQWVCRCTCGRYETRKYRAIRNSDNVNDKCRNCDHLEIVKRRYAKLGGGSIADFAKGGISFAPKPNARSEPRQ